MNPDDSSLFVFQRVAVDAERFVRFWADCYEYPDCELYTPNIERRPLTPEALEALFRWKIGPRFFERHWKDVKRLFLSRLGEAAALPDDVSAQHVLEMFPDGGAVYRIFWLHCLRPRQFPIYDQHVHRALNLIEGAPHRELSTLTPKAQVRQYVERYLPFWSKHFIRLNPRQVDQALWAFGKFMKEKRQTPFAPDGVNAAS